MLIRSICCLVLTILSAGCARDQANRVEGDTRAPETTGTARPGSAPTDEDGQWIMPAKNHASTRFSGLDQVNTSNVGQLKLAWTFSTDVLRGHEAAPIVVNKRCTS